MRNRRLHRVGPDRCPILLEGLKRLEYRGYDSAGIAVMNGNGGSSTRKTAGKIAGLEELHQFATASLRRHDRHRAHALGDARRAEHERTRTRTST